MIGVAALAYALAHLVIYFALRFWNFASIAHEMMTRISLILATAATIGLIAFGATSLDAAVRRMGARALAAAAQRRLRHRRIGAHSLSLVADIYPEQYSVERHVLLAHGMAVARPSRLGHQCGGLVLCPGGGLFTAVLEAVWIWAYQDYEPSEISDVYFTFVLGIPPALKILVLGLAIRVHRGRPARPATHGRRAFASAKSDDALGWGELDSSTIVVLLEAAPRSTSPFWGSSGNGCVTPRSRGEGWGGGPFAPADCSPSRTLRVRPPRQAGEVKVKHLFPDNA